MARLLLDTNVVSYLMKGDTRASLYHRHLAGHEGCVSFVTVAELYRWAVRRHWGASRIQALENVLTQYTVIPWDSAVAWEWARVMSLPGYPVSHADAWIAAAALRHGLPLVTHNRRHFDGVPGLTIISEP